METEELPQVPEDVAWAARRTLRFAHLMVPAYSARDVKRILDSHCATKVIGFMASATAGCDCRLLLYVESSKWQNLLSKNTWDELSGIEPATTKIDTCLEFCSVFGILGVTRLSYEFKRMDNVHFVPHKKFFIFKSDTKTGTVPVHAMKAYRGVEV